MRKIYLAALSLLILNNSCNNIFGGNVCSNEQVKGKLKEEIASAALLLSDFTYLFQSEKDIKKDLEEVSKHINIVEVSKPSTLENGKNKCNATIEIKDKKFMVEYVVDKVSSGSNTVYELEIKDIHTIN